jgi:hypothetical protein
VIIASSTDTTVAGSHVRLSSVYRATTVSPTLKSESGIKFTVYTNSPDGSEAQACTGYFRRRWRDREQVRRKVAAMKEL